MNEKTEQENKIPRLVTEAKLLDLLFPDLAENERPTRRTLLYWRQSGLLPYAKMRGPKGKVLYDLDGCVKALKNRMPGRRARAKG